MGNDLNTSMAVTAAVRRPEGQGQRTPPSWPSLDSFDQVLSLSLLDKAAAVREEQAKVKAAQAQAGYTVTGEGAPEIDALVKAAGRGQEGQGLCRGRPHP